MFSLLNKINFIVSFVFIIFMIQCSTSSPLETDKLAQLTERLDRMQTKMDAMRSKEAVLEDENAQLAERLDGMQTKMDAINEKWTKKFGDLKAENEKMKNEKLQQDGELQDLKNQISHLKFSPPARKWVNGQSSRLLTSPPTSCQELKDQNGKVCPIDGIHLLKKNNKIQAAFCTFPADGSSAFEEFIGNVDVKTRSIHFYVQKSSNFTTKDTIIPFEVARLNVGDAMNLETGIFTVPVAGIYHFEFTAASNNSATALFIDLQLNGAKVSSAHNHQQSSAGSHLRLSLTASLRLEVNDRVNLFLYEGELFDNDGLYQNHFTGWLMEEDLI